MGRTARFSFPARLARTSRATPLGFVAALALGCGAAACTPPVSDGSRGAPGLFEAKSAPSALDEDGSLPAHAEPIADYTLTASLDPGAHTVHGEGTLAWRNTSRVPVKELYFHLYLNAFKNQASVWLREPASGARGGEPVKDWGSIDLRALVWKTGGPGGTDLDLLPVVETKRKNERGEVFDEDETDARVPLPKAVAPGEEITLTMIWDDKLPSVVERTGYAGTFHMVGQWFPKIAVLEKDGRWSHFPLHHFSEFYADFGTYDVTLDVPAGFSVGATGPKVSEETVAGRHRERHVQADVHDFAWTAWDKFVQREESVAGVKTTVLFPPGYERMAERELAAMRATIPYFGKRYGKYPYDVLTLVHPPAAAPEAGGMEYPTLITTGGSAFEPPTSHVAELVTVHEFGHQYFYGLLASDEKSWPFLDEGLNSFAEADSLAQMFGAGSLGSIFDFGVSDYASQAVFGRGLATVQPVAIGADAFASGQLYGRLVYSRTGSLIETLRRAYGADVDRALGRYARKHRFRHPTPDDLIASVGETTGDGAAAALRTGLFDKGWVDFEVLGVASTKRTPPSGIFDRGGKRETVKGEPGTVWDGWVLVARRGTLKLPVIIEVAFADGSTRPFAWDGNEEVKRIALEGEKSAIRGATIDPDERITIDQDRTNNARLAASEPAPSSVRTREHLGFWGALVAGAIAP